MREKDYTDPELWLEPQTLWDFDIVSEDTYEEGDYSMEAATSSQKGSDSSGKYETSFYTIQTDKEKDCDA